MPRTSSSTAATGGKGWPYSGREGKVVYEAMLFGAGEDPDSIVQVALEIAGRRPEPTFAK